MNCVIYARVSSDRQREAGTIESQREALLDYARKAGWTVAAVEQDEGVSGTVDPWERPGMFRVLERVRREEVDVVLVLSVDRLTRDPDNIAFAIVRRELREHGVKLATLQGIMDEDSPHQRLLQDILSAVAAFERTMILERTVRGRKNAMRRGERPLAALPLGWGWDAEQGRVVEVEAEARAVREVFRLVAEDQATADGVVRSLRARGITSGRVRGDGETFLVRTSVRRMIRNPLYCTGEWQPHPEWVPDLLIAIPPLLDHETWVAANASMERAEAAPDRGERYPFLLRGRIICAHCGHRMHGQTVKSGRYAYYRCEDYSRPPVNRERCAALKAMRADKLDAVVWEHVVRYIREPTTLRADVERMVDAELGPQDDVRAALRQADREIQALVEERQRLMRQVRKAVITEDEFEAQIAEVERERQPVAQRREILAMRLRSGEDKSARFAVVEQRLAALRENLEGLTPEQRRAIVAELVEEVRVDVLTGDIEVRCVFGAGVPAGDGEGGAGEGGHSAKIRRAGGKRGRMAGLEVFGREQAPCSPPPPTAFSAVRPRVSVAT